MAVKQKNLTCFSFLLPLRGESIFLLASQDVTQAPLSPSRIMNLK